MQPFFGLTHETIAKLIPPSWNLPFSAKAPFHATQAHRIEQIWQKLRDNWLANRVYEGYEDILDACCHAWNWFVDIPNHVQNLCTRVWAKI